jgi:hypothetical protein
MCNTSADGRGIFFCKYFSSRHCISNKPYYICRHLNENEMTTLTKEAAKKIVMNAIFERAYELTQEAESLIGLILPANADRVAIQNAALKQAVKEWEQNKQVFDLPANFKN